MVRPLRLEYPNAVYHVVSRGNGDQKIFEGSEDKDKFLCIASSVFERFSWLSYAYSLMDNHYHLVIETPKPNLSKGMRQLNGIWAQVSNRQKKKTGHLFQGRFKAFLIERELYLLEVIRYVVLNPVRAQICARPEEYRYTSFLETIDAAKGSNLLASDLVLSQFGVRKREARKSFKTFIYDGIGAKSILADVNAQIFLGGDQFVAKHTLDLPDEMLSETPKAQRPDPKPPLANIIKHRKDQAGVYDAYRGWGYTMKEIAGHLHVHYSTVSRMAAKQEVKDRNA